MRVKTQACSRTWAQRLEKLENDLSQHKTSLVKESIRVRPLPT